MKYCKTCDILIDRNVNYCHECGTKLIDVAMSPELNKKPDVVNKNYKICGNCKKRLIIKISLNAVLVEVFFVIIVGKVIVGVTESLQKLGLNIIPEGLFQVLMDLNS